MRFLSFISFILSILVGAGMLSAIVWIEARLSVDGFDVAAPQKQFAVASEDIRNSTVNVPIALPISRIQAALKDQVPNVITRINERRRKCVDHQLDLLIAQPNITIACHITGVVRKDGELKITGGDGELNVRLPINFRINVEATDGLLRGQKETVRGAIVVNASITPRLRNNWNFAVAMETNFRWRQRAVIDVFGFKLDISDQIRPQINSVLNGLRPEIVSLLNSLNIKREVTSVWREIQTPQRLAQGPNIWLTVSPKSIHFSGLRITESAISTNIALRAETKSVVGPRPDVNIVRQVPNLQALGNLPTGFSLSVPVVVNYAAIERILAAQRIGNRLVELVDPDEYDLELSKFDIYPSDKAIVIGFDYATDGPGALFDSEGRAYISGVPTVNWNRKRIRFRDLAFTGAANNAVIDAASLVISQGPVIEIAEDNAIIPFENEFILLTQAVNDALQRDFGEGISMRGELSAADIDDMRFTEEGVRLLLTLTGQLDVRIN